MVWLSALVLLIRLLGRAGLETCRRCLKSNGFQVHKESQKTASHTRRLKNTRDGTIPVLTSPLSATSTSKPLLLRQKDGKWEKIVCLWLLEFWEFSGFLVSQVYPPSRLKPDHPYPLSLSSVVSSTNANMQLSRFSNFSHAVWKRDAFVSCVAFSASLLYAFLDFCLCLLLVLPRFAVAWSVEMQKNQMLIKCQML